MFVLHVQSGYDHIHEAPAPRPQLKHRRNGPAPSLSGPKTAVENVSRTQDEDEAVADVEIVLDENDNIQLVPPVRGPTIQLNFVFQTA